MAVSPLWTRGAAVRVDACRSMNIDDGFCDSEVAEVLARTAVDSELRELS